MNFIAVDFETATDERSSICETGTAFVEKDRKAPLPAPERVEKESSLPRPSPMPPPPPPVPPPPPPPVRK